MKTKHLLATAVLTLNFTFATLNCNAQIFHKIYDGGIQGKEGQQTSDGGYIFTGNQQGNAIPSSTFVVKTDASGVMAWNKQYCIDNAGCTDYNCNSIQQTTPDGGYIMTGAGISTLNPGGNSFFLSKITSTGTVSWSIATNGTESPPEFSEGFSVRQTTDGGYIAAGTIGTCCDGFGNSSWQVYLLKTGSGGGTSWHKKFGGGLSTAISGSNGYCVRQTTDGGYIIVGSTQVFGAGDNDVYLIKTDASGNLTWSKTYGGAGYDVGYSVEQTTPDGGYIIAGVTTLGAGGTDVYLIKTTSTGVLSWSKAYDAGAAGDDGGKSVKQTTDGYIITGYKGKFSLTQNVYLIKTDAAGVVAWSKGYDAGVGTSAQQGNSVQQTTDGGYSIFGTAGDGGMSDRLYFIKTDGTGGGCNTLTTVTTDVTASTTVTTPATVTLSGISNTSLTHIVSTGITETAITCVVLPISLLSFTGSCVAQNTILCTWSTATETNNDYFTIEKSTSPDPSKGGGLNWEVAGTVKGAGNSITTRSYEFTDLTPNPSPTGEGNAGVRYYRLTQTDRDGKSETFAPIAVEMNCGSIFTIYPNPASGPFNVNVNANKGDKVLIVVRDVLGKEVYSKVTILSENKEVIQVAHDGKLAAGIYTVVASSNDKLYYRKKLLIK